MRMVKLFLTEKPDNLSPFGHLKTSIVITVRYQKRPIFEFKGFIG